MNSTTDRNTVDVGKLYEVGDSFWIISDDTIGFMKGAPYPDKRSFGGLVAKGDFLEILGIEDNNQCVVRTHIEFPPHFKHDRSERLLSGTCYDGMVAVVPMQQILSWPQSGNLPDWMRRRRPVSDPQSDLIQKRRKEFGEKYIGKKIQGKNITPKEFEQTRIALGFSRQRLAEEWGLHHTYEYSIREWERGEKPIHPIADYALRLMLEKRDR